MWMVMGFNEVGVYVDGNRIQQGRSIQYRHKVTGTAVFVITFYDTFNLLWSSLYTNLLQTYIMPPTIYLNILC